MGGEHRSADGAAIHLRLGDASREVPVQSCRAILEDVFRTEEAGDCTTFIESLMRTIRRQDVVTMPEFPAASCDDPASLADSLTIALRQQPYLMRFVQEVTDTSTHHTGARGCRREN
jgi:hypothetical protein